MILVNENKESLHIRASFKRINSGFIVSIYNSRGTHCSKDLSNEIDRKFSPGVLSIDAEKGFVSLCST